MAVKKQPSASQRKTVKSAVEVKTIEQLRTDLIEKKTDQIAAIRGHKLGELTNPRVLTATRKDIARLHTAIRAAELAEQKESN